MILLSFDIEEFDMPLEYGQSISFEKQISISEEGTRVILGLLEKYQVKATFFCTARFANHAPKLIEEMIAAGHEVASHGYDHSAFKTADLERSRQALENISKEPVLGFRMPRMMPVDGDVLFKAGYIYNTSINPTYIPGRYNNFSKPRRFFWQNGVLQIPASVSPWLRIPLFWLSFHHFPLAIYKQLCEWTYATDRYLNLYFHPWEFVDLKDFNHFGLPAYTMKNSGNKMTKRLDKLIQWMVQKNYPFARFIDFMSMINKDKILS